jgi:hypothetical protein
MAFSNYSISILSQTNVPKPEMRTTATYSQTDVPVNPAKLVPKFAGSSPAEAVGFFGRKNPQHAFIRMGSKAVGPMSQLCGM